MMTIDDYAILILRYMREAAVITVEHAISRQELRDLCDIPEKEFDAAETFLSQSNYIAGALGKDGIRWLTPAGMEYVQKVMRERLPLNLDAERILRFVIDDVKANEFSVLKEILAALDITNDKYEDACQQLIDFDLIEDIHQMGDFMALRPTQTGRKSLHNNFRNPSFAGTNIQAGAIFNAPVTDSSIQSMVNAYSSQIQQNVNASDPDKLRDEIAGLLEELVNRAMESLSLEQKQHYIQMADLMKTEVAKAEPDSSVLRQMLGTLAFFADIGGTLDLGQKTFDMIVRVGPYIVALSQLIAQVLR